MVKQIAFPRCPQPTTATVTGRLSGILVDFFRNCFECRIIDAPNIDFMPRLLPRLVSEIEKRQDQYFPFTIKKKRRKSLYRTPLPSPKFHLSHYERSIVLASQSPVTNPKAFIRHKRLPPIMTRPRQSVGEAADDDTQRQMTDKEFRWWSNPYRLSPFIFCNLYINSTPILS